MRVFQGRIGISGLKMRGGYANLQVLGKMGKKKACEKC
jgi:hypothetical protein